MIIHKNLLFLCSANRWRSPTAEQIFADLPGVETDSAGLSADADVRISTEQILWADIIFVMEAKHKGKLQQKYRKHLNGKRVITLGIPDNYTFMQAELVQLLESKVASFL